MSRTGTRAGRPVVRWQILSKNPEAHASFYCKLFDWTVDASNALGYRELCTGSERGIDGGVWPAPPEAHSFVQLFVDVDDVAGAVERATALGAQVIVAPQVLPDGDEMAILLDPQGLSFAVVKPG
jgi:predicted enzyme related to lactoylglutathione lyase